jgi:hypothetical protein
MRFLLMRWVGGLIILSGFIKLICESSGSFFLSFFRWLLLERKLMLI